MEKKQNFYWLDNFKTNIHKDEFFKEHPEKTLILGIDKDNNQRNEDSINLYFDEIGKSKSIKKEFLIPSYLQKKMFTANPSTTINYNFFEMVYNITNIIKTINSNYCLIEDNTLILFNKTSFYNPNEQTRQADFYQDIKYFQDSLYMSPGIGIEMNMEILEACKKILSLRTFEGLSPDSIYLKIIQYLLNVSEGDIFFLMKDFRLNSLVEENIQNNKDNEIKRVYENNTLQKNIYISFSNINNYKFLYKNPKLTSFDSYNLSPFDDFKFFLQNISIYNKFKKIDDNQTTIMDQQNQFELIDFLCNGIRMLEFFGCASTPNLSDERNCILARFSAYVTFKMDKKTRNFNSAKINIIDFNSSIFHKNKNSNKVLNQRLFDIIYLLLRFLEPSDTTRFIIFENILDYKLFEKFNENLFEDEKYDEDNYTVLDQLLNCFSFDISEMDNLFCCISLVLYIYNIEFFKNDDDEVCKILNEEQVLIDLRRILGLTEEFPDIEIRNFLIYKINPMERNFNTNKSSKNILGFGRSKLSEIFKDGKYNKTPMTLEECNDNKINLVKNIYENLFYFILSKINTKLEEISNNKYSEQIEFIVSFFANDRINQLIKDKNKTSKELEMRDNKITYIENIYDLGNFYYRERNIKNFHEDKINKHLGEKIKNKDLKNKNKEKITIENKLCTVNKEIINLFEHEKFGLIYILNNLKSFNQNELEGDKKEKLMTEQVQKVGYYIKELLKLNEKEFYGANLEDDFWNDDNANGDKFNINFDNEAYQIFVYNFEGVYLIDLEKIIDEVLSEKVMNYYYMSYLSDKNEIEIAKNNPENSYLTDFLVNKHVNFNDNFFSKFQEMNFKLESLGNNNSLKNFFIFDISEVLFGGLDSKNKDILVRENVQECFKKLKLKKLIDEKENIFQYRYPIKKFINKFKIFNKDQSTGNKLDIELAKSILNHLKIYDEYYIVDIKYVYLNGVSFIKLEDEYDYINKLNNNSKALRLISKIKAFIRGLKIRRQYEEELIVIREVKRTVITTERIIDGNENKVEKHVEYKEIISGGSNKNLRNSAKMSSSNMSGYEYYDVHDSKPILEEYQVVENENNNYPKEIKTETVIVENSEFDNNTNSKKNIINSSYQVIENNPERHSISTINKNYEKNQEVIQNTNINEFADNYQNNNNDNQIIVENKYIVDKNNGNNYNNNQVSIENKYIVEGNNDKNNYNNNNQVIVENKYIVEENNNNTRGSKIMSDAIEKLYTMDDDDSYNNTQNNVNTSNNNNNDIIDSIIDSKPKTSNKKESGGKRYSDNIGYVDSSHKKFEEEVNEEKKKTVNKKTSNAQALFDSIFEKDIKKYTAGMFRSLLTKVSKIEGERKRESKIIQRNSVLNGNKSRDFNGDKDDDTKMVRKSMRNSVFKDSYDQDKVNAALKKRDRKSTLLLNETEKNLYLLTLVQRFIRKLLCKKYNYLQIENFINNENEKLNNNYTDNYKILTKVNESNDNSNLKLNDSRFMNTQGNNNSNLNNSKFVKTQDNLNSTYLKTVVRKNNSLYSNTPNEENKCQLYVKVIDFDLIIDTNEIYEEVWSKNYKDIEDLCQKNRSNIQYIDIGSTHTVIVNSKGKVYSFGWNNFGQCGIPSEGKDMIDSEFISRKNGYFYNLKNINKCPQAKTPQIDNPSFVNDIACGEDHSLILDCQDDIWAFGLNYNGQLGLGHNETVEGTCKIPKFTKNKVKKIVSEGDISFATTDKGEIFMWPIRDTKKGHNILFPKQVKLPDKINSVSCGGGFCIFLTVQGMLYSWGRKNIYGQLGHGDTNPRYNPTLVEIFLNNNERISQVSCGFKHVVVKSHTNKAYSWGLGINGQLGHGDFNNYTLPYQLLIENNPLTKIYQVSCGFRNSFFLIENRKIYCSGGIGEDLESNFPIQYQPFRRFPQFQDENDYSVVRINNSWNKTMSLFYVTIADNRALKLQQAKINGILNILASKWDFKSIYPPYIEGIANYFPYSIMKKPREAYKNKF